MNNDVNYKAIPVNIDGDIGFAVQPKEDCPHCDIEGLQKISKFAEQEEGRFFFLPCQACGHKPENWICVTCKEVHCSRYANSHMVEHNSVSSHPVAVSFADLSLWCYQCESYITSQQISHFQRFMSKLKFPDQEAIQIQGNEIDGLAQQLGEIDLHQPTKEELLIKGLKEKKYQKVCILSGAGISVAAGIPDFRSPGTGLYAQLEKYQLPQPEAVFALSYFKQKPEIFYAVAKELMLGMNVKPVKAHHFLKVLQDRNQLLHCYTQNIDGLELEAGVLETKVTQAHGHMRSAHCLKCQKEYKIGDFFKALELQKVLYCDKCKEPEGLVKPDVIFFGEPLPGNFFDKVQLLTECDLCIVMGTSLKVMPFALLITKVKLSVPILVINRENVVNNRPNTIHLGGDIEDQVAKIMDQLK